MRCTARLVVSLCLFLVVVPPACASDGTARFAAGQYEQLMLAVSPEGTVTGYFREEQGEGVVKTCSFYLAGRGTGGEIPVVTWSEQAYPGTLKAQKDGVTLKIAEGLEHPGCGLVLLPQITEGLDFDRVADATWIELRRISKARVRFHTAPDPARVLKSFVVSGDVVAVVARKDAWLEIEYRGTKVTTKGWIPESDTEPLVPPKP